MAVHEGGLEQVQVQTVAAARSAGKARLVYLDNLRMVVITLVVVMHVAIMYGAEGNWNYYEAGEKDTVVYLITMLLGGIGTAFVMGLLFLIAGFFTPCAYDRKGAGRFLVDRFKRLGLPLLFYGLVILPIISYLLDLHAGFQGSLGQWLVDYVRGLQSFADGPVWFLSELLIFSIVYTLWRWLTERASPRAQTDRPGETNPPGNWAIAAFALGLGVVTFVVRIWALVGVYFEPWHLEYAHAPQYIALFVVGLVAYRRNWLETFTEAQARPWRWIALIFILLLPALVVAAGALTGKLDERGAGGLNWLSLAYSLWEGFICVSMAIVVLAWFRKRFDHQSRLAKVMSDNCFAVYILHPLIIVPLALALSGIQVNLGLKFILVAPLAVTLCYLAAYLIRKVPFVRSIL
jgi:surface polysaccharide O-acyltransferase-like enzyme